MAVGDGKFVKGKRKSGGRAKDTPNRRTVEAAERARIDVENAKGAGKKLGKDMLEDYMGAFHNIAALYQNKIVVAVTSGQPPAAADLKAFAEWGGLVVKTAKELADFQSPKFRAILVAPPAPDLPKTIDQQGKVLQMGDATSIARVYQQMVRRVG